MGKLLHAAAVGVHGIDVEVAITCRGEDNLLAVAGNGGFCVVARGVSEDTEIAAIQLGGVDLVAAIDRPDVAMGVVRLWGTVRTGGVGRREQHAVAGGEDVATGSLAFAGADQLGRRRLAIRSIHRHGVDLVAGYALALVL